MTLLNSTSRSHLEVFRDRCRSLAPVLVLTLMTTSVNVGFVGAADCSNVIGDAQELYYEGRFDPAIDSLNQCLDDNAIPRERREKAYRVLGLCYLAKDYVEQARGSIEQLLHLIPDWEPDPEEDPQAFQLLVSDVKKELARQQGTPATPDEQKSSRRFWIIGGIAAAGAALVAIVLSGGDDDSPTPEDDLPIPPALPTK